MAISLEAALVAVLNAASPVTAIVSDRIQCGESAPEWQELPDLFFEVDHGDYEETFSGELEERRLPMVTLRVTARALSIAVAIQALAAASDAIDAASGTTITVDGESAIAIEDVQIEDPGSDGGYEQIDREGTLVSVHHRVAQFHVAYYDGAEPGEAADDDGEPDDDAEPTPTRTRVFRAEGTITGPQSAPITISHALGVRLLASWQCYDGDSPFAVPWEPVDATSLRVLADIPAGTTITWVATG